MKLIGAGIATYIALMVATATLAIIAKVLHLPEWATGLFITGSLICTPFIAFEYFLNRRITKRLTTLSLEELENETFSYPAEYFEEIGENDAAVIRYRDLVTRKDLEGLTKEWSGLYNRFRELERLSGHRGRPLIMEYFLNHEIWIRALSRRYRMRAT